jgi:hypothetical protein
MKFKGAFLSWLAFFASLLFLVYAIGFLIIAGYHPNAPGNYLAPKVLQLAIYSVPAFLLVAIFHSMKKRRTQVFRNAMELMIIPIIFILVLFIEMKNNPQPNYYRVSYSDQFYSIPRAYVVHTSRASVNKKGVRTLSMGICIGLKAGAYDKSCEETGYITLDNGKFIDRRAVNQVLDGVAAVYEEDIIADAGVGAVLMPDNSIHYPGTRFFVRMLLNEQGQIDRFMTCKKHREMPCEIFARTPLGILRLQSVADGMNSLDFGRRDEKYWLSFIQAHKCTDPTCGGKFD